MFVNLERIPQFVRYFQNCEKLKLSQEWRKFVESCSFKDAAVKFYDTIVDHWRSKVCNTFMKVAFLTLTIYLY